MSILCKLGLHRWKPHYRWKPARRWDAYIFPPTHWNYAFLVPAGSEPAGMRKDGYRCTRCGKVRR